MSSTTVLTIAGSDSSGGAGIQADLKTFTALGSYGAAVITALTAQSTTGVLGVHAPPPEFVELQLRAVLNDFPIKAFKTGMLYDAGIIQKVVQVLRTHENGAHIVVDPVMVSTSGHRLLEPSAVNLMRTELFPLATIVTPNIPEALDLLSDEDKAPDTISSILQMCDAAKRIVTIYGAKAVLLKGGHLYINSRDFIEQAINLQDCTIEYAGLVDPEYPAILRSAIGTDPVSDLVVDVLYESHKKGHSRPFTLFVRTRVQSSSTHGTGCTLSAAIASGLAKGQTVLESTRRGIDYTSLGISTATPLGHGAGPLNHLHSIISRVVPLPSPEAPDPFINSLIYGNIGKWKQYVRHPFVVQLGKGTLPRSCFIRFVEQGYLYMKYYARAHGLLALKSTDHTVIQSSAQTMLDITRGVRMNESFCAQWDIPLEGLTSLKESITTTAYGNFIIDAGLRGDDLALTVALMPCLLGYGEAALWLRKEAECEASDIYLEANPYRRWIDDFSGEGYQATCHTSLRALELRIVSEGVTQTTYENLKAIWDRCVELEKAFWDVALEAVVQ